MYIKSFEKTIPVAEDGHQVNRRIAYIYEFATVDAAKKCEILFQPSVAMKSRKAQLYAKGRYLYLNVPESDDPLADVLYKSIVNCAQ